MDLIISANSWKDFEQSLEQLGTTEKGSAFEELTRKIVEGGVTGIIAERSFQALGITYRALRNSPKFKQVQALSVEDVLAEPPASKGLFGSLFAR